MHICSYSSALANDGAQAFCLCTRYQLALALLLAEFLPGLKIAVEAYDPVFDAVDKAFLHRVGVKVWLRMAVLIGVWPVYY